MNKDIDKNNLKRNNTNEPYQTGILCKAHCKSVNFKSLLSDSFTMTKNKLLRYQSQQLSLCELKNNRWHIPYEVQPIPRTKYLTTKKVVFQLSLENPSQLYRARREESAYWHNSEQIECSKIVVPFGQRNKWLIFVPQII